MLTDDFGGQVLTNPQPAFAFGTIGGRIKGFVTSGRSNPDHYSRHQKAIHMPVPTETLQQAEDAQLLAQIMACMRRGLAPVLMLSAGVGALTFAALSTMAPRYTSEAQLAIAAKTTNPFPETRTGNVDVVTPRLDKEAINTHARALMAPDLLMKVATELKLQYTPEFNSAVGNLDTWTALTRMVGLGGTRAGETQDDRVLGVVVRQLEVSAAKDSRFIPIRFTSADPQLSADFANRLAETYRASLVSQPVDETSEVVRALIPKVEQLKAEVLQAEAEAERYRAKTDQYRTGPQNTPLNDQKMATLSEELTKAEAARSEVESRWRTARDLLQSGSAEVLPDVQKSPIVQGLIAQRVRLERQVAEASASLLPAHPRMQQLNADVAGLKRQITAEVQKVVQSIEKDHAAAVIKAETIKKQIAELKSKVVGQSGNEAELRALESTAKTKRTELERLQKQLEDNRTVVNTRQVPVEAQLISRARANSTPTFPRTGPTTLLAAAAALVLGLAATITRALVSIPAVRQGHAPAPPRTEPSLPAERRGPAPAKTTARPATPPQPAARAPVRPALEAPAKALVERLLARTDMTTGIRTLVTSEAAGVPVHAQAMELAEALARSGKRVVLVVWNLSGEPLALARSGIVKPGLLDLLQGHATFEQVIGRVPGSDVHIIQPGAPPSDPDEVLDPDRLNLVLDALDEAYEQIVVAAGMADATPLFEAIEGRFDAAVIAACDMPDAGGGPTESGLLLGFEVSDIDIVRCTSRPAGTRTAAPTSGPKAQAAKPRALAKVT